MSTPVRVDNIGFRIWRGTPQAMTASHIHSDIEINFLHRGEAEYFIGGRFEVLRAGSLNLFWAGVPHSLTRIAPESEMSWGVIPLAWLLQWELPAPFVDGLLRGRMWGAPQPSTLQRELLLRWCEDFENLQRPGDGIGARKIIALEVEAFMRRLAMEHKAVGRKRTRSTPAGGASSQQAEKLAAFIAQNYRRELTIQEIAATINLHPNYAMQLFRDKCGLSLWEYVLRLRVSHAQYLLLTTNRKLADIARDSGFVSQSRFYAAFEKYSGSSPRAWREKLNAL